MPWRLGGSAASGLQDEGALRRVGSRSLDDTCPGDSEMILLSTLALLLPAARHPKSNDGARIIEALAFGVSIAGVWFKIDNSLHNSVNACAGLTPWRNYAACWQQDCT